MKTALTNLNVPMPLQEILSTIHRNQQQIDLLSGNNTQLVKFLLQTGMIQSMQDIPAMIHTIPLSHRLPAPETFNVVEPQPKRKYQRKSKLIDKISEAKPKRKLSQSQLKAMRKNIAKGRAKLKAKHKDQKPKRVISAAGRKAISIATKKRWAEQRRLGNTTGKLTVTATA